MELLPDALTESPDFIALSSKQKGSLEKRLAFLRGVLEEACAAVLDPSADLVDSADGLELDLTSAMTIDLSDTEGKVSTWIIHSSWLFEVRERPLVMHLSGRVRKRLDEALPCFSTTEEEFKRWLSMECEAALLAFSELSKSTTFDQAMAYLIAIDSLLGRLLVSLCKWRLWSRPA